MIFKFDKIVMGKPIIGYNFLAHRIKINVLFVSIDDVVGKFLFVKALAFEGKCPSQHFANE